MKAVIPREANPKAANRNPRRLLTKTVLTNLPGLLLKQIVEAAEDRVDLKVGHVPELPIRV